MKRKIPLARGIQADRLERIVLLERQLAPTPVHSRKHRALTAAIRVEAIAYRKSLDFAQAAALHDTPPQPAVRKPAARKLRTVRP